MRPRTKGPLTKTSEYAVSCLSLAKTFPLEKNHDPERYFIRHDSSREGSYYKLKTLLGNISTPSAQTYRGIFFLNPITTSFPFMIMSRAK
jgi:hypothetical protein